MFDQELDKISKEIESEIFKVQEYFNNLYGEQGLSVFVSPNDNETPTTSWTIDIYISKEYAPPKLNTPLPAEKKKSKVTESDLKSDMEERKSSLELLFGVAETTLPPIPPAMLIRHTIVKAGFSGMSQEDEDEITNTVVQDLIYEAMEKQELRVDKIRYYRECAGCIHPWNCEDCKVTPILFDKCLKCTGPFPSEKCQECFKLHNEPAKKKQPKEIRERGYTIIRCMRSSRCEGQLCKYSLDKKSENHD